MGISDHCRVTVRIWVRVRISVVGPIQTAGESDKMRINHVIKSDQWRSALQICPHRILLCPVIRPSCCSYRLSAAICFSTRQRAFVMMINDWSIVQ